MSSYKNRDDISKLEIQVKFESPPVLSDSSKIVYFPSDEQKFKQQPLASKKEHMRISCTNDGIINVMCNVQRSAKISISSHKNCGNILRKDAQIFSSPQKQTIGWIIYCTVMWISQLL